MSQNDFRVGKSFYTAEGESNSGAHYWTRRFRAHGYTAQRMPPQFGKPSVKSNKNATGNAEAITEAVTRPTMRFVPIKEVE